MALAGLLGKRTTPGFDLDEVEAARLRDDIRAVVLRADGPGGGRLEDGHLSDVRDRWVLTGALATVALTGLDSELLEWCLDQAFDRPAAIHISYQHGSMAALLEGRSDPIPDIVGFMATLDRHFEDDLPLRVASALVMTECQVGDPDLATAAPTAVRTSSNVLWQMLSATLPPDASPFVGKHPDPSEARIAHQAAVLRAIRPLIASAIDPEGSLRVVRNFVAAPQIVLALLGIGMPFPAVSPPRSWDTAVLNADKESQARNLAVVLAAASAHQRIQIAAATRDIPAVLRLHPDAARKILLGPDA